MPTQNYSIIKKLHLETLNQLNSIVSKIILKFLLKIIYDIQNKFSSLLQTSKLKFTTYVTVNLHYITNLLK